MQSQREVTRPDALTGRLLDGRYRIGERIARGGMASVYQATDVRLDRLVAVKVMHPGLGDGDEFASRFVREARAAARLSHPHIVAVHDQGTDDGTVFLVMEYVPGQTLRDVIAQQAPLPPRRALALVEPIAAALATAHRAGLIHRDVKPENVLVSRDHSKIKVADFGLAKAVSADTQHTATGGVLIGTVSYLAPELVTDGRADARADVYALGVLLFELLTGHKPHEGESPIQVAYAHVHADVPAPSSLAPGIPDYVDALVARATSRDPGQRPADAGVLLHLVRRVHQALLDGLTEDAELSEDLRPRRLPAEWAEAARPEDTVPVTIGGDGVVPVITERPGVGTTGTPAVQPVAVLPPAPAAPTPGRRPPTRPSSVVVRPRRRSRRGPLTLLLLLVLVAGAGIGAYWYGVARYTSTPGVLGMAAAEAKAKLHRAGLTGREGTAAYSETVPKGEVLRTDPEPGSRVLDHGTVTLVLSLGKERYAVPDLAGRTEDQAQDALLATHLSFGKSASRWSEIVPEGSVIASTPAAGVRLRRDTAVDLVVSKGPKPIRVADWAGRSAEAATRALEGKGLVVTRDEDIYSDTVDAGDVVSQSPSTGTLHRGDEVRLTVSKGPELVAIPDDLVASGVDAAQAELEGLGFTVRLEKSMTYLGLGYVMSVDPGEGSMAPKGSTVTLKLV